MYAYTNYTSYNRKNKLFIYVQGLHLQHFEHYGWDL